MDVLSDLLSAVRLTGAVYFDIRARAPWVAESPAAELVGGRVMPAFDQVIFFHIVLEGHCWAALTDDPTGRVRLGPGEAVVVPSGERHVMASDPGMRAEPAMGLYRRPPDRALPYVFNDFGGAGEPTRYACGFLGYDRPFNPVLTTLPRLMHVTADDPGAELIVDAARAALRESERPRPGMESFLGRLGELVFIEAIRQHIAALPADATGWFAGLRDRHVGRALALMHEDPAARWTIDLLAEKVGLSRSTFAERFSTLIGAPPMQYLANWRLQLAANRIESQGLSIAQAAAAVGYDSEAAFARAFKKRVGVPPGSWRRSRRAALRSTEWSG
ncbi:AraC family transcriptional regulator [Amaricoccus sp.]|uniref:AraC family transcriptional regulator n=1 Tax=Amaricoccus sp. TaxID=1872485 RepID=UPI001B6123EA|nr:AraC family transcriptional regulator [Amaricoccus sp.]MBP7241953.1 AraC family transcriptional regulator [Amaricoccus sp.]